MCRVTIRLGGQLCMNTDDTRARKQLPPLPPHRRRHARVPFAFARVHTTSPSRALYSSQCVSLRALFGGDGVAQRVDEGGRHDAVLHVGAQLPAADLLLQVREGHALERGTVRVVPAVDDPLAPQRRAPVALAL